MWVPHWRCIGPTPAEVEHKQQDTVQVNTQSVQFIATAYSEVRIGLTEISEQRSKIDKSG